MTTYVLVHGAWRGSWCWKGVRRKLMASGHEVFTPTLTGLGERSHLLSQDVDLSVHVLDVVNLIKWEDLHDIVLVGHSYSGLVVRAAADRIPERIRSLVYLDAFIAENGQSLYDACPGIADPQRQSARRHGEGWSVPPIPAVVNATDLDWVDRQCTAQSIACFEEPIVLTGACDRLDDISYIGANDHFGIFAKFQEKAKTRGWRIDMLACSHDVMIDMPDELSDILLEKA